MPFFDLPSSKATTKKDQQLLKKISQAKTTSSTSVTLKGTGKLLDRIQAIVSLVKSKFKGKEDELTLITKEGQLIEYIDKCLENGVISIDTETTGLDPILDQLVGICIYTPGKKAAYIPVNHISYITNIKCNNQLPIDFIRDQFKRLLHNVKTIWFNAPFDIRFLGNGIGVWLPVYFDCSIAAHMLNTEEDSYRLKNLHQKYCWGGRGEALSFGKLFDNIPFNLIPIDVAYLYAASDAIYTYELYEFQAQYLEPDGKYYDNYKKLSNVFFNIEMKSMETFISMEQTGTAIDYEYAEKLSEKYHKLSEKMQDNLAKVCEPYNDMFADYRRSHPECKLTDPINFASPTQLAIIFYDIFKIKPVDKKNPRGTGKDILQQIDHPLAKAILDARALDKAISTYIDKLPEDAKRYPDKRIHCKFNQYGAACVTGDTSILTNYGSVPISTIFNEDDAEDTFYDTDLTIVNRYTNYESASHRVMYKNVPTIKLTLRGGYQIEGTPNHPIICSALNKEDIKRNKSTRQLKRLSENCDFRKLEDIKVGDLVEIPFGYNIFPTEYVDINDLRIKSGYLDEGFAEQLGIYDADNNDSVHISIMKSPKSVICAYVRGLTTKSYFDTVNQELYIHTNTKESYNFLKQFFLNIGILTDTKFNADETFDIVIIGKMYKKFIEEIGIIDSDRIPLLNDSEYKNNQYLINNGCYYACVDKIEYGVSDVYDLTVPETHSFISNGIISHNTGRVSSDSPNLQNVPSRPFVLNDGTKIDSGHDIRKLFTASPGHILLSCDYSGQEVRVTAHLSNDKKLIQAYRDGKDAYSEIAAISFNTSYEECCEKRPDGTDNSDGKERRSLAKKVVLGILYSMGIPAVAKNMNKSVKDAQTIYNKVLSKFDGVDRLIQESEEFAREYGYVETVWGRRRHLSSIQLPYYEFKYKNGVVPDLDPLEMSNDVSALESYSTEVPVSIVKKLTDKLLRCRDFKSRELMKEQIRAEGFTIKDNTSEIAQAQRQCVNARVQGSAADLTKLAQIELFNNEELRKLGFRMLIPVHDEIIAECPVENAKRCAELMSYCMVHAGRDLCVPLKCDVAAFYSWYDEEVDVNSL